MDGIHLDGDWTQAQPIGATIFEYPFEGDDQSLIVTQRFQQALTSFVKLPTGSGPTFLIEATSPILIGLVNRLKLAEERSFSDDGGGIISWDRVFTTVPQSRQEAEGYVYTFQVPFNGSRGWQISEIPIPTTSFISYDYFYTTNPVEIEVKRAFKWLIVGPNLTRTTALPWGNQSVIVEDSKVRRWMGNVFERQTRIVPVATVLTTLEAFGYIP